MVIRPEVGEIRAEADSASRKLSRDVHVSVLTPEEWDSSATDFVAHLKSEPQVEPESAAITAPQPVAAPITGILPAGGG